jgi:hypothetical protein
MTWTSKLLIAAILTAGSSRPAHAGPDPATPSTTEISPAPPTSKPLIHPADDSTSALPQAPATPLSYWAAQIAKLAQAGIDDNVILSFLDNVGTVNLGADQIIYLTGQGVSRNVISAMLQHDFEINSGARPMPTVSTPMPQAVFNLPESASTAPNPRPSSDAAVPSNEPAVAAAPAVENPPPEIISANIQKKQSQVVFVEFPVWEYASADSADDSPPSSPPDEAPPKHTYSIREPYPEPIADPIIMVKGASMRPNVLRIDPFP